MRPASIAPGSRDPCACASVGRRPQAAEAIRAYITRCRMDEKLRSGRGPRYSPLRAVFARPDTSPAREESKMGAPEKPGDPWAASAP